MEETCKVVEDLLPLYCDGICSEDSVALVEAHVKDCLHCSQMLSELRANVTAAKKPEEDMKPLKKIQKSYKKLRLGWGVAILCIVAILLGAAACVLPWPTFFEVKMTGYLYTDTNFKGKPVEITAKGTKLNYLFFHDQTKMQLTASGLDGWEFSEYTTPDFSIDEALNVPYYVGSSVVALPDREDACSALCAFSLEEEVIMILIKDRRHPMIFCSTDDLSKKEIYSFFSEFREFGMVWMTGSALP